MALIPPDKKQCQAEVKFYNPFLVGGDVGHPTNWRRCENFPIYLATEAVAGDDGERGQMMLCDHCKGKLIEQFTKNNRELPTFTKLKVRKS